MASLWTYRDMNMNGSRPPPSPFFFIFTSQRMSWTIRQRVVVAIELVRVCHCSLSPLWKLTCPSWHVVDLLAFWIGWIWISPTYTIYTNSYRIWIFYLYRKAHSFGSKYNFFNGFKVKCIFTSAQDKLLLLWIEIQFHQVLSVMWPTDSESM